jgi:hypothetical protein
MNIHESRNPRHADPLHGYAPWGIALFFFMGMLLAIVTGCSILPLPDPDPVTPTTTTTTTSTTIPDNAGLVLPEFLYGGCSGGEWSQTDPEAVAHAALDARCNLTGLIEAMGVFYDKSEDGFSDKPFSQGIGELIAWVKIQQAHALWTCIGWANGNDDDVISRYGQENHRRAVERLYAECGSRFIVMVPVIEQDYDSEKDFSGWCLNYWGSKGITGWNGRGRPETVPQGCKVAVRNLQGLDDIGPDMAGILVLLNTDSSGSVNSLRAYWNPAKVGAWMPYYRAHKRSINLRQYQSTEIDKAALKLVGDAYNP